MCEYEYRTFVHDNREYEIRVSSDAERFYAQGFLCNRPITDCFDIERETVNDAKAQIDVAIDNSPFPDQEQLVQIVISEVTNYIREQYISAVEQTKNS